MKKSCNIPVEDVVDEFLNSHLTYEENNPKFVTLSDCENYDPNLDFEVPAVRFNTFGIKSGKDFPKWFRRDFIEWFILGFQQFLQIKKVDIESTEISLGQFLHKHFVHYFDSTTSFESLPNGSNLSVYVYSSENPHTINSKEGELLIYAMEYYELAKEFELEYNRTKRERYLTPQRFIYTKFKLMLFCSNINSTSYANFIDAMSDVEVEDDNPALSLFIKRLRRHASIRERNRKL